MKRIALVLALAGSALLGSVATTVAGLPSTESTYRAALLNCALADEAVKIGLDTRTIPATTAACARFRFELRQSFR